jgi:cell division transport system permease protein
VENRYVVDLGATPGAAEAAAARLQALPGVRSASAVPESEMRRTLERWLGDMAASTDLPVPALVTLELAPEADSQTVGAAVRRQLPGARLTAESAELAPLMDSIRALQWLALALVLLIAGATGAAIVLAARGALDTHRSTIEIMHGIGATDAQIVRLFERKIAVDALAGAAAGAAAAFAVLVLIVGAGAALAEDFASSAPLGGGDLLLLVLVPIAAVVLAVLVARWSLLRALRAAL